MLKQFANKSGRLFALFALFLATQAVPMAAIAGKCCSA